MEWKGLLDFYRQGDFPTTSERMARYRDQALPLALNASLRLKENLSDVTHLIVTSCTGFYAPGLDIELVSALEMNPTVERTVIGFMGCYAAFNALKQAKHIVRSEPASKVLVVNLELCTLHFQQSNDIEQMLAFLIFADGCSMSLVSSEERGIELESFYSYVDNRDQEKITWQVGDQGFDMHLSTDVPNAVGRSLEDHQSKIFNGLSAEQADLWAIHPGGRGIIDAIRNKLEINESKLKFSRDVLRRFGNMLSATVMFVLKEILHSTESHGQGYAMAFGPGLTIETLRFHKAQM